MLWQTPLSRSPNNLSVSSILAALHEKFSEGPTASLNISSVASVVVDSKIPEGLLETIWQHAYKQSEDELLLLYPTHDASQSLLSQAISSFPGSDPQMLVALNVLQPFLTAMTPQNLNQRFHNGLAAHLSLNSTGEVVSMRLKLAVQPLINVDPLVNLPSKSGFRSFDVFYYMLYSQLEEGNRAELLSLKNGADEYDLLKRSGTSLLPDWVTHADDYALAKDWADAVAEILPKSLQRSLMMALSGIMLMGNSSNADDYAEGAALVGLDSHSARKYGPEQLIRATYTSLVESVESMVNRYLSKLDLPSQGAGDDTIYSVVTLAELSATNSHKFNVLRSQFDNNFAMNQEMVQDGISLPKTPPNIAKQLNRLDRESLMPNLSKVEDFSKMLHASAEWYQRDESVDFFDLDSLALSNRVWTVLCLAPTAEAEGVANKKSWASSLVSSQIRDMFVAEWIARAKLIDYTADYESGDFVTSFAPLLPPGIQPSELASWAEERFQAQDFFQGYQRVYLSEQTWFECEQQLNGDMILPNSGGTIPPEMMSVYDQSMASQMPPPETALQVPNQVSQALGTMNEPGVETEGAFLNGDSDDEPLDASGEGQELMQDYKGIESGQDLEVHTQTHGRKLWVWFVWLLTFWIPSTFLDKLGKMKRRDVRLAWREKIVIFFLIFLLNCFVIFYMIILGRLICPDFDKVWNHKELGTHQGSDDFYVAIHGNVYDISKFYTVQHSDNGIKTSKATMMPLAGQDLSDYFPPPLSVACPGLVSTSNFTLQYNETSSPYAQAMHKSGPDLEADNDTALHELSWYKKKFEPKIKEYYKGRLVETKDNISSLVDQDSSRYLVLMNNTFYDLSNYMSTIDLYPTANDPSNAQYNFFPEKVTNMFRNYQGMDITDKFNALDEQTKSDCLECMNNVFKYADLDFRKSAKCQTSNIILLVIAGLLTSITLVKFLASLRFGSAPMPVAQDKFVICQVPIYTENEDDMRLAIDSLTNLQYDNRRKLLFLLCDGMITGAGNDRSTPQIVLDLLGVDDTRVDPEPKAYHAIAEGSRELNYAKVYSGLYESGGNMVPYVCVVKVGAPGESKPGNRGKRDSQLIVMNFLNRVHYGDPMSPLDLELFHQINNIVGIEPERFDYIFTIDADTKVLPDSLNRMVAACTADNKISAVCGETGIENEQQSLSTMVQVYEYFISHHLTKAFESLFGTITCLPGCFSLYRLRTMQRSKPLIISSDVIREYSLRHIDTLHKKNLFSLGEDRYLTTLMSKHFPKMRTKFVADAKCLTQVPDDFGVLLSQRRRWINSTVHNLVELLHLETMCGFCLFSMRGVVFTDLIGTLMLPSVVIYLAYLIYVLASHSQPLPLISIVLICSVYGLQALVFILHRRFQHIFWMIVYIAAYPFHSFILPIYSFWNMDNFGWGNTRVVLDESKGKKVVLQDSDDKYDPHMVPFEPWTSYAARKGLPGRERAITYDVRKGRIERDIYEEPFNTYRDNPFDDSVDPANARPQSLYSLGAASRITGAANVNTPFDAGTAAQIRDTVQQVLNSTDLDTMTPLQLRFKVGDLLGTEFTGERAAAVDHMIDSELEKMDEDLLEDDFDENSLQTERIQDLEIDESQVDEVNEHTHLKN